MSLHHLKIKRSQKDNEGYLSIRGSNIPSFYVYPYMEGNVLVLDYYYLQYSFISNGSLKFSYRIKVYPDRTWELDGVKQTRKPTPSQIKGDIIHKSKSVENSYWCKPYYRWLQSSVIGKFLQDNDDVCHHDCYSFYLIQFLTRKKIPTMIPEKFKVYIDPEQKDSIQYVDNKLIIQNNAFLTVIEDHKIYHYNKEHNFRISRCNYWHSSVSNLNLENLPNCYKGIVLLWNHQNWLELNKPIYNTLNHFVNIGCEDLIRESNEYNLKSYQDLSLQKKLVLNKLVQLKRAIHSAPIDNRSLDEFIKIILLRNTGCYVQTNECNKVYDLYFDPEHTILNELKKIKPNITTFPSETYVRLYLDYRQMLYSLFRENIPSRFPRFPKINKLQHYHDLLIEETRRIEMIQNQENEDKYVKLKEDLKKLEYSNDKYSIIIPDSLQCVIDEGRNLNHCVGSYINAIIDKHNKIYFLRKNDSLNKSWFTIDVDYYNNVRQIHTSRNKCVKDVPEADELIQFIKSWMSEKSLKSECGFDNVRTHL